jgi:hypothetical protein
MSKAYVVHWQDETDTPQSYPLSKADTFDEAVNIIYKIFHDDELLDTVSLEEIEEDE